MARRLGFTLLYGIFGLQDQQDRNAQKHRTQQQRWHYAQHAFVWQSSQVPSTLLIVDDVFTTGSTLNGAAYCAQQQGVQQVYGAALARVPWLL